MSNVKGPRDPELGESKEIFIKGERASRGFLQSLLLIPLTPSVPPRKTRIGNLEINFKATKPHCRHEPLISFSGLGFNPIPSCSDTSKVPNPSPLTDRDILYVLYILYTIVTIVLTVRYFLRKLRSKASVDNPSFRFKVRKAGKEPSGSRSDFTVNSEVEFSFVSRLHRSSILEKVREVARHSSPKSHLIEASSESPPSGSKVVWKAESLLGVIRRHSLFKLRRSRYPTGAPRLPASSLPRRWNINTHRYSTCKSPGGSRRAPANPVPQHQD